MTDITASKDCNDSANKDTGDSEPSTAKALDGGWGWFIVLAAFIINVITDGCSYSFGVLFTNLIEYFHASRSKTAWIGSIFSAVPLLCGPLASIISNRIGYRKATVLGGIITTVGFSLSYFVNSIEMLCVTYGMVAGLGISLPYLNSIVAVSEYFEAKRSLATGLSECGAGIGTLIFAPLLETLITEYGWRGAVLVMGGIASNIVVCGALFRPLFMNHFTSRDSTDSKFDSERNSEPLLYTTYVPENKSATKIHDTTVPNGNIHISQSTEKEKSQEMEIDLKALCEDEELYSEIDSASRCSRKHSLRSGRSSSYCSLTHETTKRRTVSGGSIASLPHIIRASKCYPNVDKQLDLNKKGSHCPSSVVDLSVFKNRSFLLFAFTNFVLYFWYDVPYVFTVDRATMLGTGKKDASLMVAVIGILHTIGNILYGYLGDRKWMDRCILYCVSLTMCGVTLIAIPFFVTYVPSIILAALFGLFSAAAEALCSVIIVDILGIEKLTDAFGIMMFLQGTANLVGPPVAGWLFDISGRYKNTFCTAGVSIATACCLYVIIPFYRIYRKRRMLESH